LVGYESYEDFRHPRCEIDLSKLSIYDLFNSRLGDLIFRKDSDLEPAGLDNIGKLEVLRGELIEEGGRLFVRNSDEIVVYHKEHGLLKLKAGNYQIYRVPYIIRGHD
jgi:hypothetical protein